MSRKTLASLLHRLADLLDPPKSCTIKITRTVDGVNVVRKHFEGSEQYRRAIQARANRQ